jgi:hypothetical protein
MKNKITVKYQQANSSVPCSFQLFYTLQNENEKLLVSCFVEATDPHYLPWLHTRNFITTYLKEADGYVQLFNESDYHPSVDGNRFREIAKNAIMRKEGLTVLTDSPVLA